MMESLSKTLEDKFLNEEQLEQVFTKILQGLMELLENKESINSQDKEGFTLLHCACALRYHLLAASLIQWGVNVNMQDMTGNTPFHWAMKNRDQKMIKILVDYVDLNKSAYNQIDFSNKPTPNVNQPTQNMERITNKIDDMALRLNPDEAATTIQSAFRGWRVREELEGKNREKFWDKLESAATKVQTPSTRLRLAIHQKEVTKKKEHEAAKKIQTAFKDYKTRRMQQNVSESQKRGHDARGIRVAEKRK